MNVLIIGAGPAGLSCAISILEEKNDINVFIAEKKPYIRPICAGGLGFYAINHIKNYIDIPIDVVEHEIKRFILLLNNNEWVITTDDLVIDNLGYVIDRRRFDNYLLKTAQDLGAEFKRNIDGWSITQKFNYIVDAGGPYSSIKYTSRDEIVTCIQKTFMKPHKDMMIYISEKLKSGYIWCFPAGKKTRVGAGYSPNDSSGKEYAYKIVSRPSIFFNRFPRKRGRPSIKPLPLSKPLKPIDGKIIRVGTAARLICPVTGAGIMFAVVSGFEAGRAIAMDKPELYIKNIKPVIKDLRRRYILKKAIYPLDKGKIEKIYKVLREFKPESTNLSAEIKRLIKFMVRKYPLDTLKLLPALLRWW